MQSKCTSCFVWGRFYTKVHSAKLPVVCATCGAAFIRSTDEPRHRTYFGIRNLWGTSSQSQCTARSASSIAASLFSMRFRIILDHVKKSAGHVLNRTFIISK